MAKIIGKITCTVCKQLSDDGIMIEVNRKAYFVCDVCRENRIGSK